MVAQDFKTQGCLEKHNLENYLKSRITPSDKKCLLQCLEKINFSDLLGTKIRLVDKNLVHKTSQENVMISEIELPIKTKIGLFSGDVTHTTEINLDHVNQEHIEAILLTELCRQASMVSLSRFLGSDAEYHIIEEFKKYRHIVQRSNDILIHKLPVKGKKNKGIGLCLFTVYQNSKLCLSGYFSVMYFKKGI
ncbi:AfsA-related hotdog domain-containing protein [Bacillus sp. 03113]|uniref:AfsA-related hotdog domain-containing protein n=1 Tax=Bacillus sp. 03113 TaxID=2578211 RepID=UPI0015E8D448|nr:AfsA-related hotdog domain-containing protein [Bacillus sp. 03113]